MIDFKADLHCHSLYSDGTDSPQQLIDLARNIGLQGLSITDHDTVQGYDEAIPYAKQMNFPLLSGVEFSAVHKKISVHILAYSFSLHSPSILELCKRHSLRRKERNLKILDLLAQHQMPLQEEDILDMATIFPNRQSVGRPHIALAMQKKKYVKSVEEAFQMWIGDGKPCFASGMTISVEETIHVIHKSNGFAIIAHPHLMTNTTLLQELLTMDFDGIEGYYARFPLTVQQRWVNTGLRKNWIVTGGSDFHGSMKQHHLGSSWVNQDTFTQLFERYQLNQQSSVT